MVVGCVVIVVVNVGDLVVVMADGGEGADVGGGTAVGGTVAVAKGDAVGSGVAIVGRMVGDNDVGCTVGLPVGLPVGRMVGVGTATTASVGDVVLGAAVVAVVVVLSHRQSPKMANTICNVASEVDT